MKKLDQAPERNALLDDFMKKLEKFDGRGISYMLVAIVGYTDKSDGVGVRVSLCMSDECRDNGDTGRIMILQGFREAIDASIAEQKRGLQ